MKSIRFSKKAEMEFTDWKKEDIKNYLKIKELIKDICKNHPFGIGKPEKLRHQYNGHWSRKIDKKNRLIYDVKYNILCIYQCKGHYNDK
jgi:toxin YoeB